MRRFKIGQKVVAIRTIAGGNIVGGVIYEVDGFAVCPKCGNPCLYLVGMNKTGILQDSSCGWSSDTHMREFYKEKSFTPLQNNADAVEYKLKVSIPELTEIKETQLQ